MNTLSSPSTPTPKVDVNLYEPNEVEKFYIKVRADVNAGNLDLEETLWQAPLDVCLKLASIIWERTREHFAKEKKNE